MVTNLNGYGSGNVNEYTSGVGTAANYRAPRRTLAQCSQAFQLFPEKLELCNSKCWQPTQNCFKHHKD